MPAAVSLKVPQTGVILDYTGKETEWDSTEIMQRNIGLRCTSETRASDCIRAVVLLIKPALVFNFWASQAVTIGHY